MKFRLAFIGLIAFCFLSFIPAPHSDSALQNQILSETNAFRKANGLPPLEMKSGLNSLADSHSENMAARRVSFGHGGFNTRSRKMAQAVPGVSRFAENVAYGPESAKEVVKGWKNSPGHRKNMLGKFKYIGIGVAKDRNGRPYYTQLFAG